ncbi:MAG TPA: S1 RNA-binding domain-containing protein [Anaeromyxobacteraceae bacterium]|nr:S1 RNA-binding domain-containing protein [Anaeromyxobacteraceae bacterium]
MARERKTDGGPVVIRKGHLKPPPPGSKIEAPVVEKLEADPRRPPPDDRRPLWQRLAEEKAAGARPPAPAPPGQPSPAPPRPARDRSSPSYRPERGGREARRERDRRGDPPRPDRPPRAERGAPAEPPPLPDVPVPDEGSFADMLAGAEAETAPRRRHQVGDKVAGKIIQLGHDVAFLELGSGVAEAMIDVAELADADGNVTARVGDVVDAVVVKTGDRGVIVSRGHGRTPRDHARESLAEAARAGLPVEGVVKAANKGGLEVEVHGVRAFCPVSQIDLRFVSDPASFVGQKLAFRVQRADARDVVLSRRALLEEERAERAKATREKLAPGAVLDGVVTSVQDFGAFVDVGGLEGLVHVSELAWDRVSRPQDLLRPGDPVQVQVLRIEEDAKKGERIALSVKALSPRPEPAGAPPRPAPPPPPKVGDVVEVSVEKIETFGLFARFAGGRGLVPASETGTPRGSDLRRAFKVGDTFAALVAAIDERGRIRLSRTAAQDAAERREADEYLRGTSGSRGGQGFGTLGDLLRQKLERK